MNEKPQASSNKGPAGVPITATNHEYEGAEVWDHDAEGRPEARSSVPGANREDDATDFAPASEDLSAE